MLAMRSRCRRRYEGLSRFFSATRYRHPPAMNRECTWRRQWHFDQRRWRVRWEQSFAEKMVQLLRWGATRSHDRAVVSTGLVMILMDAIFGWVTTAVTECARACWVTSLIASGMQAGWKPAKRARPQRI